MALLIEKPCSNNSLLEWLTDASNIKTATSKGDPINTTTQNGYGFIFTTVDKVCILFGFLDVMFRLCL